MLFALLNNKRVQPSRNINGAVCPLCRTEMTAKCGEIRVHHWAHKNKINCDHWLEDDSPWRWSWMGRFPDDWCEHVITHEGEKHLADIQTPKNTIILLHQSRLTPEIVREREKFYQTPVWILNAGRFKNHTKRLLSHFEKKHFRQFGIEKNVYFLSCFYEDTLPQAWLKAQFPIFLDFSESKGFESHQYQEMLKSIWCLMPFTYEKFRVFYRYSPDELINSLRKRKGQTLEGMHKLHEAFNRKYQQFNIS